ncbi:hypothetical protein T265_02875, partial [Opisthorchis viverrini]
CFGPLVQVPKSYQSVYPVPLSDSVTEDDVIVVRSMDPRAAWKHKIKDWRITSVDPTVWKG